MKDWDGRCSLTKEVPKSWFVPSPRSKVVSLIRAKEEKGEEEDEGRRMALGEKRKRAEVVVGLGRLGPKGRRR